MRLARPRRVPGCDGNANVEFVRFPGVPQGFFSDDSPQSYEKEAAEDGWKRCIAFLDKHLET